MNIRSIRIFLLFFFTLAKALLSQSVDYEFRLNTYTYFDQKNVAIGGDNEGNFVATWISNRQDNELTGVFARLFYKNGLPKGEEFQVNTVWEHLQEEPAIAVGKNGNFVITWVSYIIEGKTGGGISARIFDPYGNPLGPEFQVNDYSIGYQGEPAVAMDNEGNFIIVWQSWEQDGDSFGISARIFDPYGNPFGPEFQVNSYILNDQIQPKVTIENDGKFIIVWTSFEQDGDRTGVFAQRFSRSGSLLGPEFCVNFITEGRQESPGVAVDSLGYFTICWHSYQDNKDSYEIFARTFYDTGSPIGPEFKVNAYSEAWQIFPAIDCDNEGNFVIVWQSWEQDGNSFGIFARLFNRFGQPLGSEFQVNSLGAGSQEAPDVIIFSKKNFFIAWQSRESNDMDWDVFIKIFKDELGLLYRGHPLRLIRKKLY